MLGLKSVSYQRIAEFQVFWWSSPYRILSRQEIGFKQTESQLLAYGDSW